VNPVFAKGGEKMRRVVITGMGVITPVGLTLDSFWSEIKAGHHGIARIENQDMTGQKVSLAAQVKGFLPENYGIEKKEARRMDPYTQYAVAAASMALEDCGTMLRDLDEYRVGVIIGSGTGGFKTLSENHRKFVEKGPNRVSALMIPMMIANMAAGAVAMRYGYKGVNYATVTACASSSHAIGEAFHAVRDGYADAMIAGGAEATVVPFALAAFANMTALSQFGRPGQGVDTVRRGARRLRDGRRRGYTGARDARARQSARRENLRRNSGLRSDERRLPHHEPRPRGHRSRARRWSSPLRTRASCRRTSAT
jgi:3-oxoacyl-(acyl-carrier-protein) synthase